MAVVCYVWWGEYIVRSSKTPTATISLNPVFLLLLLPALLAMSTTAMFLLVPSSASAMEDCHPEAMSRCTDPLKVVTDNKDLGFATTIDELNKMCP